MADHPIRSAPRATACDQATHEARREPWLATQRRHQPTAGCGERPAQGLNAGSIERAPRLQRIHLKRAAGCLQHLTASIDKSAARVLLIQRP